MEVHILTLAVCSCTLLVMCKGGGTGGGARGALAPPILDLRTRTLCTRTLCTRTLRMRTLHADNRLALQPLTPAPLNVYLFRHLWLCVCISCLSAELSKNHVSLNYKEGLDVMVTD